MNKAAAFSVLVFSFSMGATTGHAVETATNRATEMLLDACPRLAVLHKTADILSLEAERRPTEASDELEMGWREVVEVKVELAPRIENLPHDFYASGQVCRYDIGHGSVVTTKSPCKKICGFDLSNQGPAYLPLPASKSLQLATD